MNAMRALLPVAVVLSMSSAAYAAPSAEEISQLGSKLTPWGAEKAGNADGSIPAYTGGMTTPPANFDKSKPGWRPNPYPQDKSILRINAANVEQHKDKLSAGTIALIKKFSSFYVDVYPTRRSVGYPQEFLDNTVKNASRCSMINDGLGIDTSNGCGFGLPFPLPKNGLEAMWNHDARYRGAAFLIKNSVGLYVKPSGDVVNTYNANSYRGWGFYDTTKKIPETFYTYRYEYYGPTRLNGNVNVTFDILADSERRSWGYSPATRRVRMSPDSSADTPVSQMGGAMVFDEDQLFSGKKDRYDWKLVGKKEMYIPYNNYRFQYSDSKDSACSEKAKFTAGHPKPDCVRWELHRVWHVQATLKDGKRHIYSKRDLYFDEDSYSDGLSDNYDHAGNLYRVNLQIGSPLYDLPAAAITDNLIIDMISGVYGFSGMENGEYRPVPVMPANQLNAESMNRRVLH